MLLELFVLEAAMARYPTRGPLETFRLGQLEAAAAHAIAAAHAPAWGAEFQTAALQDLELQLRPIPVLGAHQGLGRATPVVQWVHFPDAALSLERLQVERAGVAGLVFRALIEGQGIQDAFGARDFLQGQVQRVFAIAGVGTL